VAGGVRTAKQAPHQPGTAPALGVRAGIGRPRHYNSDRLLRAGVELTGKNVDGNFYGFFGGQKTDKDGRFKIEGIMPGVKVGLATSKPGTITCTVVEQITMKPGKTKDLGDVKSKDLQ